MSGQDHRQNGFSSERLSPFAERFANVLFREFPRWRENASLHNSQPSLPFDNEEPYEGYDLLVRVLSPHRTDQQGIQIQTDSQMQYVIVGIGPGCAELADWDGTRGEEAVFGEAIALAKDILNEEYVGVTFRDRRCGLLSPAAVEDHDDVENAVSWRGTLDVT